MQFGPRSERLPDEQLQFAFEEVEASLADNEAEAEKRSPEQRQKSTARRRAGRGRLPAHLPRIEQVLLPESTACPCCQGAMVEIGADTAERLDVIPAQFRVLVTKRPKYACRACEGVVVQAAAPARLIEGGMPTEATVAQVLVARYADHRVPRTHRLERRCGAVWEMRVGPSAAAIRSRRQTTASCCRKERGW